MLANFECIIRKPDLPRLPPTVGGSIGGLFEALGGSGGSKTSFQLSRTSTKPHQGVPLVLSQLSRTLAEVDRWMDTIVLQ